MRALIRGVMCGIAVAITATACAAADRRAEPPPPVAAFFNTSPLPPLPFRHQNHCGVVGGHYICADHCGVDYQVYYCPNSATGCCHVGHGYCDAGGRLRCTPAWF